MDTQQNSITRISIQSLLSPIDSTAQTENFSLSFVEKNAVISDKCAHEEQAVLSLMMISSQPRKIQNNNNNNSVPSLPTKDILSSKESQVEEHEDDFEDEEELSQEDDDSDFEDFVMKRTSKKRKQPSKIILSTTIVPTPNINNNSTSERTELSDSDSGMSPTDLTASPSSPSKATEDILDDDEDEEDDEDDENEASPRKHKKARRNRFNDDLWFEHFNELKKFKKKHGHCNVTQAFTQWRVLANWVHNQRKHQGKRMPPNRRQMLVELGFEFDRSYAAVSHQNKLKAAMRRAAEAQRAKEQLEAQHK